MCPAPCAATRARAPACCPRAASRRPPAAEQDATLPEGVTSYGQLAMASDAPRFLRATSNVADISPQRLHPTRLFFPRQHYAPSVRPLALLACLVRLCALPGQPAPLVLCPRARGLPLRAG